MNINTLPPPPPPTHHANNGLLAKTDHDADPELLDNKHKFYQWIDVGKGIGIILVVLGHCIFPFVQLIDYFHMPLFFLLAGLTFSPKSNHDFILSKINRIMVPYVFFAIISAILSFIPHAFGGPFNGPLWFLQNIFAALIIIHISTLSSTKFKYGFMLIVLIASYFLVMNESIRIVFPFGLSLGCLSAVFIFTGYLLKDYFLKDRSKRQDIFAFAVFTAFFLGFALYANRVSVLGAYASFELFHSDYPLSFILALLGSSSVIFIAKLISKNKWLEYLGRNSLCIMAVHFPLAMFLDGTLVKLPFFGSPINKLIVAFTEWCIVLAFSVSMCHLCKTYIPRLTGYKPLIK